MAKIYKFENSPNNLNEEKINQLKHLFPESFIDNEFCIDRLLDSLGLSENYESDKTFGLNWVGKNDAKIFANLVTNSTLKPNMEKSVDFDNNDNIIIEGDNLEVLKVLRKSYSNKIDVIYIDPPYNTGNDFVYNDKFAQSDIEYKISSGQIDENGNKTTSNQKSDGKYHTNWLNMIYPRLILARQLLKDDGVIFISIDDNEEARLKLICDEIFGEENFVSNLVWKARRGGGNDAKNVAIDHEYIYIYSKNKINCKLIGTLKTCDDYKFEDKYVKERGKYNLQQFDRASLTYTPSLDYPIIAPDGTKIYPGHVSENEFLSRRSNKMSRNDWRWMMSEESFKIAKDNDFIVFEKNKNDIWNVRVKTYELVSYKDPTKKIERYLKLRSVLNDDFGTTRDGNIDISNLGLKEFFSYPKPIKLIKNLIKNFDNKNALVLDFFAGSGTTGQSVMYLNKEDNGNRKFILVQIPEFINKQEIISNYKYISDITRERIKKSIQMYDYNSKGFKYFELDNTNFNLFIPNDDLQKSLFNFKNSLKDNWKPINLLYELILKEGLSLNTKIIKKEILNNIVYVEDTSRIAFCIDNNKYSNIEQTITEIYKLNNSTGYLSVYLIDDNFGSNLDKDRCMRTLQQLSGDVKVWII